MARPKVHNRDAVKQAICKLLADGKSLRKICEQEGLPEASTVCQWLRDDAAFAQQYARAREAQADTLADEIIDIVDSEADSARARVRMDARKWYASKLAPKKYGDKLQTELTGADGGPVQVTRVERVIVDPKG